jgi:hypothetical protein
VVYEKDLGKNAEGVLEDRALNPDRTWRPVLEE